MIFYEEYTDSYPWSMMISQENSEHQLTGQLTDRQSGKIPKVSETSGTDFEEGSLPCGRP